MSQLKRYPLENVHSIQNRNTLEKVWRGCTPRSLNSSFSESIWWILLITRLYVMHCLIWYHLCNLKNVKNTHEGVILLLLLVNTKSNTPWVFSMFYKLYIQPLLFLTVYWILTTNSSPGLIPGMSGKVQLLILHFFKCFSLEYVPLLLLPSSESLLGVFPVDIYLLKANNGNIRTIYQSLLKVTNKDTRTILMTLTFTNCPSFSIVDK